jgi:hypothetical protein
MAHLGSRRFGTHLALLVLVSVVSVAATGLAEKASARPLVTCPTTMHHFVDVLTEIDGRLDVGLSFRQYERLLSNAHVAYARLVPSRSAAAIGREPNMRAFAVLTSLPARRRRPA